MLARKTVLQGASLAAVAIVLAVAMTSGRAAAQSRAAHRWNHDPANTGHATAEPGPRGARVLILHEVYTDDFTFIDVGEPGDSPGDYGVFRDLVADPETGELLGYIDVQCIAAYADQCRGSISLQGQGQIVFDGITPLGTNPDRFAITGGTGVFAAVRGKLIVSFPAHDYARLALKLLDG
jgi:hypothetical protein